MRADQRARTTATISPGGYLAQRLPLQRSSQDWWRSSEVCKGGRNAHVGVRLITIAHHTNAMRAFSASAWRWLMPRLGAARTRCTLPGCAREAVATGGETRLRRRRIGDYPKAEAKAPPWPAKRRHVAGCILRHLSNGLSMENASAVEFALVQEHLRETSVVTKRAAHACAARVVGGLREDTVRVEIGGAFRCWERDSLSRRHGHVARAERPGHLCRARYRNEPLTHAFWCIENPALDAQRLRNPLVDQRAKSAARDLFNHRSKHISGERVLPARAGLTAKRSRRQTPHRFSRRYLRLVEPVSHTCLAVGVNEPAVIDEVVGEPGRVGQQFADRRRPVCVSLSTVRPTHSRVRELGQEATDRIIEADFTLLRHLAVSQRLGSSIERG